MSFNITTNNVENYANLASFPATGQDNIIYIDTATNTAYYWNGVDYQSISGGGGGTGGTFAVDLDDSLSNVTRVVSGGITRYIITHNLNTENLILFIYNTSQFPVFVEYKIDNANDIQLYFGGTVNNSDYRIVIKH